MLLLHWLLVEQIVPYRGFSVGYAINASTLSLLMGHGDLISTISTSLLPAVSCDPYLMSSARLLEALSAWLARLIVLKLVFPYIPSLKHKHRLTPLGTKAGAGPCDFI